MTLPKLNEGLPLEELLEEEVMDEVEVLEPAAPIVVQLPDSACGERLDKEIAKWFPQYSRSRLQQWIEEGHVLVDGQPARVRTVVLGGETVTLLPQHAGEERGIYHPEEMDLPIVYEDETVIVLNKPAGCVVHPGAGNWSGTLLNGLLYRYPLLRHVPRAGIVHRLDKDTTGLMVVAKTLEAQTHLVRQLQARTVKRDYVALVWGMVPGSGKINARIARHPRDRIKMATTESLLAKPAVTHYERMAEGQLDRHPVSLVQCHLETGRTHQIRVHMLSLGFPLVGDPLYGKAYLAHWFPRQALHAWRLGFIHPISDQACEWSVELPEDFSELLVRAGIEDNPGNSS